VTINILKEAGISIAELTRQQDVFTIKENQSKKRYEN